MKRLFLIIFLALTTVSAFGQSDAQNAAVAASVNPNARFRLFPTQNMWTYLLLDTGNGIIYSVQYSTNAENRKAVLVNSQELVSADKVQAGRFTLYPTQNTWIFFLVDQIDGICWQVQWSLDASKREIVKIPFVD